jgi:hypothetical protein
MKLKPGIGEVAWMGAGATALLVLVLAVVHFQKDPSAQLAFKADALT